MAAQIMHGTATTVSATVTLDVDYIKVEVLNRDASNTIFFTTDGTVPTVDGNNCQIVPPKSYVQVADPDQAITAVKLLTDASTAKYTITGLMGTDLIRNAV